MEKRTLLAITITFAILIIWWLVFPPQQKPPQSQPPEGTQESTLEQQLPAEAEAAAQTEEPVSVPPVIVQPVQETEEKEITVENSLFIVRFSNRGGIVKSWKLKRYFDNQGDPLELVAPESEIFGIFPLDIRTGNEERDAMIHNSLFVVESEEGKVADEKGDEYDGHTITFTYADERGLVIEKKIVLFEHTYIGAFEHSVHMQGEKIESSILWGAHFGSARDTANRFYYAGQCIARISSKLVRIQKKSVKELQSIPGMVQWAGIEDQYFAAIFMPRSSIDRIEVLPSVRTNEGGKEEKFISVVVPHAEKGYRLFVGPKDYHLLTAEGNALNQTVNFGSFALIAYIAKGLYIALVWLYDHTIPNYGFGIILLTVVIRIIFFPLTQKSFVSMKKMQTQMKKLQPKINAIKERYKKKKSDYQARQKMNQEIMALYKSEGINPLGGMSGCLPLLLQLPILWAFYNVLSAAIELRQAPFLLWVKDLSAKDPYYITPLLMGATMFIQQKMSGPVGGDPMQQRMMMFMPIIFTFLFLQFPSGLVLYWLVNNILGIGQQYLINRQAEQLLASGNK